MTGRTMRKIVWMYSIADSRYVLFRGMTGMFGDMGIKCHYSAARKGRMVNKVSLDDAIAILEHNGYTIRRPK